MKCPICDNTLEQAFDGTWYHNCDDHECVWCGDDHEPVYLTDAQIKCLADAKLGQLVRKGLESGPIELWNWTDGGCGARFSIDHNPGERGQTHEEALKKLIGDAT